MATGTIKWGGSRWGSTTQSAGSGSVLDVLNCFNDVIYRLGFTTASELSSTSWVTAAELFQWADETAKNLSYAAALFVVYDNSISIVAGTSVYTLPAAHVFTIMAAALYSGALQLLRVTSVRDLWSLDAIWQQTSGAPLRASFDAGSIGTVTLYPKPDANATLGQICQEFPGTVSQSASTLELPTVLQDYFSYAMLAGARGKESEAAMPEIAAHFSERCKLYEQLIEHLWGPGQ